jgi:TIR domain-containing protein
MMTNGGLTSRRQILPSAAARRFTQFCRSAIGEHAVPSRKLFASYCREDREIVSRLCSLLRVGGTHVFRDEDSIQAGKEWNAIITKSLKTSGCVLVFWSANSVRSDAVRDEYSTAVNLRKDIVPVLLDETKLPAELHRYQWIDCRRFVVVSRVDSGLSATGPKQQTKGIVDSLFGIVRSAATTLGAGSASVAGTIVEIALGKMTIESQNQLIEQFHSRLFASSSDVYTGSSLPDSKSSKKK